VTEEKSVGITDREFQQTWGIRYDGEWMVDEGEVAEAKFVSLEELHQIPADTLTPWFQNELKFLREKSWQPLLHPTSNHDHL